MQRRFVVNLTAKTLADDWSFILQGSNKNTRPDDVDTSWETVATIQYDGVTAAAEDDTTFSVMYRWYRLNVTKTSGTGSVTFTASLYETNFDLLFAYKTLDLIAMSWKTGLNQKWDDMRADMAAQYESTLQAIKFTYDENRDGVPEVAEPTKSGSVRLTR
jgi:hypothetical protein